MMQKRKLYIHVGLPKTGTSTLQERVFPRSRYLFLGKENIGFSLMKKNNDPYLFVKFLIASGRMEGKHFPSNPKEFRKMRLHPQDLMMYKKCISKIALSRQVVISDEGFTLQPLKNDFYKFIGRAVARIQLPGSFEEQFMAGVHMAEKIIHLQESGKVNFLPFFGIADVLQRCLDAFDAELGKVLIVDRDYGSWFVSFFLQCFRGSNKGKQLTSDFFDIANLMKSAGLVWRWDRYLMSIGVPGYALADNFSAAISGHFGKNVLSSVRYSSDSLKYAHSLAPALVEFGVDAQDVEAQVVESRMNEADGIHQSSKSIDDILSCRGELAFAINSIISKLN